MSENSSGPLHARLSRRERQIMDIIYQLGRASAAEVREHLIDPPSYSAVRAALRLLEEKNHLVHEEMDGHYIFSPKVPREKARVTMLQQLLRTFFNSSTEEMVSTLLNSKETNVSGAELDRLAKIIQQARKEKKS